MFVLFHLKLLLPTFHYQLWVNHTVRLVSLALIGIQLRSSQNLKPGSVVSKTVWHSLHLYSSILMRSYKCQAVFNLLPYLKQYWWTGGMLSVTVTVIENRIDDKGSNPVWSCLDLGANGNEGVLCISQSSSITGTSLSNCLVSYLGHSLGVCVCGGVLLLCREAVGAFYSPSRLSKIFLEKNEHAT